jgi:hypothetical protein
MAAQILLVPIAVAVRVLGPKAVIRLKAIHKNMVKAKKQDMSEQEYLSFHVDKKLTSQKKTMRSDYQKKEYIGKRDPSEKKTSPGNMDKSAKNVEKAVADKAKRKQESIDTAPGGKKFRSTESLRAENARNIIKARKEAMRKKKNK